MQRGVLMRRVGTALFVMALLLAASFAWRAGRPAKTPVTSPSEPHERARAPRVPAQPLELPLPDEIGVPSVRSVRSSSPFASEDDYLRELERLNAVNKPAALELVEQGAQWYRGSGVRQEAREAMGITLLVDLGQIDEARARTRRFIVEHPTSRYRPLVQGKTGVHPRPLGPFASSRAGGGGG